MRRFSALILVFLAVFALVLQSDASPKVTQAGFVNFNKNGLMKVLAVEEFRKPFLLYMFDEEDKVVYSTSFDTDGIKPQKFEYANPFLRFRSFYLKGLPSPVVVAVLASPGGSDVFFRIRLIGEINGEITTLHPDIELSIQDGVYLGHIDKKYGYGMVVWRFQWNEAHYDPHKYEISIYRWDVKKRAFVYQRTLTTRKKFKGGCRALKHYGLSCKNYRDEVIRPDEEFSTLGIEDKMLQKEKSGDRNLP
jgi:hypothetical protein